MDVIGIDAPKLKALARRLEPLMQRAQDKADRDPLDYLLGALHGLLQAKRLKFRDRDHSLADARGRAADGTEYWQYGPLVRVGFMREGKLRVDGAWAAGFYFNSALARMAAVLDRAVRRKAIQRGLLQDPWPRRCGPPPTVWDLLKRLGLPQFTRRKLALARVYQEVNPLKHSPAGLAERRNVTMAAAIAAFKELLALLEHPRMR